MPFSLSPFAIYRWCEWSGNPTDPLLSDAIMVTVPRTSADDLSYVRLSFSLFQYQNENYGLDIISFCYTLLNSVNQGIVSAQQPDLNGDTPHKNANSQVYIVNQTIATQEVDQQKPHRIRPSNH